ncbi:MAG: ABC transporter substrate-binding protein [Sporichthyaceae bacterium]
MTSIKRGSAIAIPLAVSAALVLTACGGGDAEVAQAPAAPTAAEAPIEAQAPADADDSQQPEAPAAAAKAAERTAPRAVVAAPKAAPAVKAKAVAAREKSAPAAKAAKAAPASKAAAGGAELAPGMVSIDSAEEAVENARIAEAKQGLTDTGVTKNQIKVGTINMHSLPLAGVFVRQLANGTVGTANAINDRGGVLGRRMQVIDCDDATGEVSRTKSCIKKMVAQDKIFSFIGITSWGSASIHDDLAQHKIPAVGQWAYSQTEWQDPYMFPVHMSMIHEAMANANWVRNVMKVKTYGLICLNSPEMQLACAAAAKILDASGAKLVKKADVSISETSMSSQVIAMRAANPEHILHYVINPATTAKFVVESSQQNYWPSKGISGNHLAAEVLGTLFGKHPVGRYWTNTTYRMWGPEFTSTMNKYARQNAGTNHHIVQAAYVGVQVFAQAAKAVGPNLTRERLMAQLNNGDIYAADASLDQKFSYRKSERFGENWDRNMGQGREFMYRYTSSNTRSNPDGSPNGFELEDVIYTWK